MRAVTCAHPGGADVLTVSNVPPPVPGPEQLLVRVRAAALNWADTLQRRGEYPPPAGESELLGVEAAGEVEAWGARASGFERGDRVFGLVPGGAYAEYCLLDHRLAMPIPTQWSWAEAAAVPEAFLVADTTLFDLGELRPGDAVLVHAAGSGVGSACIQVASAIGARVFCTAGSAEKIRRARELGADAGFDHTSQDFATEVLSLTGGAGIDVVEDFIGAPYLARNLAVLKPGGRLVHVGGLGGHVGEIDLKLVCIKRLQIKGTILRSRSLEEKRAIVRRFRERSLPMLVAGRLRPVVDSVFPLESVRAAHERIEAKLNFGKIVLTID